jgi:hypothetical protein
MLAATPSFSFAVKEKIAIIYNQRNNTFNFTASEMKKTLEMAGHTIILSDIGDLANTKAAYRIILTKRGTTEADALAIMRKFLIIIYRHYLRTYQ